MVEEEDEEDMEDEDVDVESDLEEDKIETKDQIAPNPIVHHPRPLFQPHQPPFLAAGLAAMAAAAAKQSSQQQQQAPSGLFPGLNGWQPPSGMPGFPPLGFPGFQHPLFKPGNLQFFKVA